MMRAFAIVLALMAPASAGSRGSILADGFLGAPATTIQRPTALNGYTKRPPWHVAGVDYAVGMKPNLTITLGTPALFNETNHRHITGDQITIYTTGTLPTGVLPATTYFVCSVGNTANQYRLSSTALNASGGTCDINASVSQSGFHNALKDPSQTQQLNTFFNTPLGAGSAIFTAASVGNCALLSTAGANAFLFDGWDFSVGGGVCVNTGSNNTSFTVQNSYFLGSVASVPSAGTFRTTGPNITFQFNVMDAGTNSPGGQFGIFTSGTSGTTTTIQYNWLKNWAAIINAGSLMNLDYQFNLIENFGRAYPQHTNSLQWSVQPGELPGVSSATVQFNTQYQQAVQPNAGGEVFQFYNQSTPGLTYSSVLLAYNTMIALTSNPVSVAHATNTAYVVGSTITGASVSTTSTSPGGITTFIAITPGTSANVSPNFTTAVQQTPFVDGGANFTGVIDAGAGTGVTPGKVLTASSVVGTISVGAQIATQSGDHSVADGLNGAGVTTILSNGTGSGGNGTYNLTSNSNQAITSRAMTAGLTWGRNDYSQSNFLRGPGPSGGTQFANNCNVVCRIPTTLMAHDNYMDFTGILTNFNLYGTGVGGASTFVGWQLNNNYNMNTGLTINPNNGSP